LSRKNLMARLLIVAALDTSIVNFLLPHVSQLTEAGWEVELGYRPTSGWAEREIRSLGIPWHEIPFSRSPLDPVNLKAVWQLKGILSRGSYDVIHVHMPVAAWLARLAARLFSPQTTVIYTAHGFQFYHGAPVLRNIVFLALEKLAGRWTDYLVVINREDAKAARRYHIVDPERVRYMAGIGVDTTLYDPARVDEAEVAGIRQALDLKDTDVLFTMVAAFRPRKRHSDALRALTRLQNPRVHLAFAGLGSLMQQMRAYVQDLDMAGHVHFLGYRRDVSALIRASLTTVLPSEAEGLPRTVMESLALEVPVIGTDIRGTRELLEDGCGILVPVRDVQALSEAMWWMITHPDEAAAMGRRGRRKVQGLYELRNALRQTEALYREVSKLE
jgi:glycosyltransferase involved in cell wall biosynthesis